MQEVKLKGDVRNLFGRFHSRGSSFVAIFSMAAVGVFFLGTYTALSAVSQTDPIDYSDPNLAMGGGYVSEASSACIRKHGATGGNVTDCIRSYKSESDLNELRIAEKKKPAVD